MNQDTRRRASHQQKELTIHEDTYKFLDDSGRFVIRDFSAKRPFSSFLSGIAGPLGIPMWVFYVNRGQAIASFGIENKNNPIMEFEPANKAYQNTPYTGFRTFLKLIRGEEATFYEPFSAWNSNDPSYMIIGWLLRFRCVPGTVRIGYGI